MIDKELFSRVSKRLDALRNEMIDMQIKLTSLPAIAPSSGGEGEIRKAEYLVKFLGENGFTDIELIKAPDIDAPCGFRPNILARIKGKSSDKTIWVMSHTDVVPPGELSLWRGDPYKAWIEKGRIHGRGVEDNQQDLVASIFAVKALMAENILPSYNIGLVLVADEETGSKKGIDYVLEHTQAFRKQDIILVPDAGDEKGTLIEVAEKSIVWLKFKTVGSQTHASSPEKGVNSFKAASYLITELDKLYGIYDKRNELFDPPISTFEPTKKENNVPNINTIPGEDVFYLDCRILPEYNVPDFLKSVREIADGIEKSRGVKIEITEMQKSLAAPPTSPDAPVVLALKSAIRDVLGHEAKAMGIGGGTVAALFRRGGFNVAVWSTVDDTCHQPNEYCVIENLVGDAKVFAHVFMQE